MRFRLNPSRSALLVAVLAAALAAIATAAPADDVAARIATVGDSEAFPGDDAVVVFDETDIDVEPSGLSHIVNHRVTKVLTTGGAVDLAFQRFDFDPATQLIEVRKVVVHRADGTQEPVDTAGLVDIYAPAHAIYWGARMLGLDLPRLDIGDAVEIETYRKGFQIAYLAILDDPNESKYIPPMAGHYYDSVIFQEALPIVSKTYTLRTPREMPVQFAVYNGEVTTSHTFDEGHFTYVFSKQNVSAVEREWRSPGVSDYAPKVVMATVADWGEKSRWFCEVNESQFDSTPEIDARVAEITTGLKTDAQRIAAINHWVAQNIRYCGLNMGKGEGYTLHPGDMIYRERSGVCKDIAGMSITMLRAAGFEVYPAMTMAGARVERTPADQFNHCVVALRNDAGGFDMLDPTWVPWSRYDWSRAEGEQHYVVGSPEGEDLTAIRTFTAEENRLEMTIDAAIDNAGDLKGTITMHGHGYSDTGLRRAAGRNSVDDIVPRLERWLATLAPGATLTTYKFTDPLDWDTGMRLEVEFTAPGYAAVGGTTISWRPIGSRLLLANYNGLLRFANSRLPVERETPTLLWSAQRVDLAEKVQLPRGCTAVAPDENPAAGSTDGAGHCDFEWKASGRTLELAGTVVAADRTITVERWPDFQEAVAAFAGLGDLRLCATKKGGRS